jgi:WD40 repeat protein
LTHTLKIEDNPLSCCDFTADGRHFLAAGYDRNVYLYDENTRQLKSKMGENSFKIPGHQNRIFCVKAVPDDYNLVVSGSWDRSLRIYDLRISKPVAMIGGPLISGSDAIDISGDQILVASYRK